APSTPPVRPAARPVLTAAELTEIRARRPEAIAAAAAARARRPPLGGVGWLGRVAPAHNARGGPAAAGAGDVPGRGVGPRGAGGRGQVPGATACWPPRTWSRICCWAAPWRASW